MDFDYKNCKYCKEDGICSNENCLYDGYDCKEFVSFCHCREEKYVSELNPESDIYGKEQAKEGIQYEERVSCCGDVVKVAIEGVGKEAEVVTNENGGKQSKSPMAAHLIPPEFLGEIFGLNETIKHVAKFMQKKDNLELIFAIRSIEANSVQIAVRIAKILQEGAEKYEVNNWRLIPQEEHINHALIHLFAAKLGDTQDNHIDHALCRLMMAYATQTSKGFSYTEYIKKVS